MTTSKKQSRSIGEHALAFLFGRHVFDDSTEPTANYQKRQNKLVLSGSLVIAAFWVFVVWSAAQTDLKWGIVAAFAILYYKQHAVAAMLGDAVFDSLWERVNLQSRWLDVRLTAIERRLPNGGRDSQTDWQEHEAYDGQLADSWYGYPERQATAAGKTE